MKILKLETLKKLEACKQQLDLFQNYFGDEVEITVSICVTCAAKFHWQWAARQLFDAATHISYKENIIQLIKSCRETIELAHKLSIKTNERELYDRACLIALEHYTVGHAEVWAHHYLMMGE